MATMGIEWICNYHGNARDLPNACSNARGFYNSLDGVQEFEWSDDQAWDQDFEQTGIESALVDTVDICYFCGHGNIEGLLFGVNGHDDGVARPSDMQLGGQQIAWIVIDACEVLRYEGGTIFDRWRSVFNGIHYVLGFQSIAHDCDDRGRHFAERLNEGWSVRQAWIRACEETEDSLREWAYLRADQTNAGADTYNDHWIGRGAVSPDPCSPDSLCYSNGPC